MVANQGSVEVPLLSAVLDCSLEAPSTNLTEVSSDPMCDPKEDISSDPTCDPKEESFTRLGKRDSLPRIPRYCRQSNQATMPYNKTSSNRQQRPIKKTVADDLSHPIQGPRSDRRGAVDAMVSTVPGTVTLVKSPLSTPALPASAIPALSVVILMLKVSRRLVSSVSHLNQPVCFAVRLRFAALPVFVVQPFQVSRLFLILIVALNWSCVNVLLIASMRLVLVALSLQTCFAIQLHLLMQW